MRWIGAWFWSRIRENENWAQTLVRVLGNLFRITLTTVAVLAAAIAWQAHSNSEQDRRSSEETRSVIIEASLFTEQNDNRCNAMFPLALNVRNASAQTLMSNDIELNARRPGTSTNTLSYGHREVHWDQIVPPGYALTECFMPPESAPNPAVFSTEPISYSVILRRAEQWMIEETKATVAR